MFTLPSLRSLLALAASATCAVSALLPAAAQAMPLQITVTTTSLSGPTGVVFAPLGVGFHSGSFDAFETGSAANTALVAAAELGNSSGWRADLQAADAGAVVGQVGPAPQLPGVVRSASFIVDPLLNPYFSFVSMVVPSNDFFIGNDSATEYRLFDASGALVLPSITQTAADLWDAGSELHDPAAAAFVGDAQLRTPQNGVVSRNFSEFAQFNGLTTAAGYVFNSGLAADTAIYRIDFSVSAVPEPQTWALLAGGLVLLTQLARRRSRAAV